MNQDIKIKIEHYLLRILRNEIIIADESYFILQTINEYWDKISIDGYNLFFKSVYSAYFIRLSLALSKLFDKPSQKYDTISIPFLIDFIERNFANSAIQERYNLNRQFCKLGYDFGLISSLSDVELNGKMIDHFKLKLPSVENDEDSNLSHTLKVIKTYRDKYYAHNEYIEPEKMPKTTFKETVNLLLYAKQFVSIFSLAYLNMFHSFDGENYIFTEDAMMTNTSFKRILVKANLIDEKKI